MSRLYIFCICLSILVAPAYAVDVFKVSDYGGGHQIWFEAEAFDARDPDGENTPDIGFKRVKAETKLKLPDDTFGDALVDVRGTDTIWLRYDFDISKSGGKGGTWYLSVRMINPNNRSEWGWVLGDDGKEIPEAKPAFDKGDDRIFEDTIGPPWGWSTPSEGEVKQLQNGKNTMMVWFREGDTTALRDVLVWFDNPAYRPTDDDYRNAKEIRLKPEPVEPAGKLATTWASIKAQR